MMAEAKGRMAVIGMFDGVHLGHRWLLADLCRQSADMQLQPMVFTFSNHPLSVVAPEKAPALLTTAGEKTALLHECGVEDVVCRPFSEEMRLTPAEDFLRLLHDRYGVEALLLGFNNRFGHDRADFAGTAAIGARLGVKVLQGKEFILEPSEGAECPVSSSLIRQALLGNLPEGGCGDRAAEASRMLGRPYSLAGTVVSGKQLGRKLGFPTANLAPDAGKLVPASGVYACRAFAVDRCGAIPAMVNIGHRPTVDADGAPISIEAHLIGLPAPADLYGQRLRLDFISHLRQERRFDSPEQLADQLEIDRTSTLRALQRP